MNHALRLLCTIGLCLVAVAARADTITVFAAASLTDALQQIAKAYEAKTGDGITFSFAGSNVLAKQIEQGAPADLFFSADEMQMSNLEKAGLIDSTTRRDLLANTLVIIAPTESPLRDFTPAQLAGANIQRIAMADPAAVPAGVYAKQYLTKAGLWARIEGRVVPTANVRAAADAVASSDAEVGIVYKTDAELSARVKILYEVPRAEGPEIKYPIAMIKTSSSQAAAKKFLAYLESPEARAIFKRNGFLPGAR